MVLPVLQTPLVHAVLLPTVCWSLGDENHDGFADLTFTASGPIIKGIIVNATEQHSPYQVTQKPLLTGNTGDDGNLTFQMIPDGHYVWSTSAVKCTGQDVITVGDTLETQFTVQTSPRTDFLTWFLLAQWVKPGDTHKAKSFLEGLATFYNFDLNSDPFPTVEGLSNFERGRLVLQWMMRLENHIDLYKDDPSFSKVWDETKNLIAPFQSVLENAALFLPANSPVALEWNPDALGELTKVSFENKLDQSEHSLFLQRGAFIGTVFIVEGAFDLFELYNDGDFKVNCPLNLVDCVPQIVPLAVHFTIDVVKMAIGGIELFLSMHTLLVGPVSEGTAKTLLKVAGRLAVALAAAALVLSILELAQALPSWASFRDEFTTVKVVVALLDIASAALVFSSILLLWAGVITVGSAGTLALAGLVLGLIALGIQFLTPIVLGPDLGAIQEKIAPVITQVLNIRSSIRALNETDLAQTADLHDAWATVASDWAAVALTTGSSSIRDDLLWAKDYLGTLQGAERNLSQATLEAKMSLNETLASFLYYGPESMEVQTDPLIRYVDLNGNGRWDAGEPVVYDTDGDFQFCNEYGLSTGCQPQNLDWLISGDYPSLGTALASDPKIGFLDLDADGRCDCTKGPGLDTLVYDSNSNGIYDRSEPTITTPMIIKTYATGINSTRAYYTSADEQTYFSFNASIYHRNGLDSSQFVFDNNTLDYNQVSQTIGETLGPTSYDKISTKNCDLFGCSRVDWAWVRPVENDNQQCLYGCPRPFAAFYTNDPSNPPKPGAPAGRSFYLVKDPTCGGLGPSCIDENNTANGSKVYLDPGTLLEDTKLKYADSNGNKVWDPGETVVYDSDDNSRYDENDVTIAGPPPSLGADLSYDSRIIYDDANSNHVFDPTETVVYDSHGNHRYDPADQIIANLKTFFLYKLYFEANSSTKDFLGHLSQDAINLWLGQINSKLSPLKTKLSSLFNAVAALDAARERKRPSVDHRPIAHPGPPRTVEGNTSGGANVQLDGSASYDPNGDALNYSWTGDFGNATGARPIVFLPLACHEITLVVGGGGELSDPATTNICIVDTTPPIIDALRTPIANANGWNNRTVIVSFRCSDMVSGVSFVSNPETNPILLTREEKAQTATGYCIDGSGNISSKTVGGINIDKAAPAINASRTPGPNSAGWNNATVTVHFGCSDRLSGVASCTPDIALTNEGRDQSATGVATDLAGNGANVTVSGINIDETPPVITAAQDGTVFILHQTAYADAHCSDALSGLDACVVPTETLDTSTVGQHSYMVTSTDKAGNSAVFVVRYQVHYIFISVSPQPANKGTQVGRTIPERFHLADALGNFVATATAQLWVDSTTTAGKASGSSNMANYFRYDPTSNQYMFNFNTTGMTIGSHTLYITLNDGTVRSMLVTLTS